MNKQLSCFVGLSQYWQSNHRYDSLTLTFCSIDQNNFQSIDSSAAAFPSRATSKRKMSLGTYIIMNDICKNILPRATVDYIG